MNPLAEPILEAIQRATARLLARSPTGRGLCLIGGFRYRLLDGSARASRDIDYHWEGNLDEKQAEVVSALRRRLLPLVKREYGYDGSAEPAAGPEAESSNLRTVKLAFWRLDVAGSRIEIPVDITRIVCLDAATVRTADGVVYPTRSDADLIESKVIALLGRVWVEHRDFLDVYLLANHMAPDAPVRLREKCARLGIAGELAAKRLREFTEHPDRHIRGIEAVMEDQLDPDAATNIRDGGGAPVVLDAVVNLLRNALAELPGGVL